MNKEYKVKDFIALQDNVIFKPIKVTEKDGFVRPQQEEDRSELGEVISIGAAIPKDSVLKHGDIILYNKYSTTKTDLGPELWIRYEDILGVLKKK